MIKAKVDKDELSKLYSEGQSLQKIAIYFGVSRQRIHQIVKNYKHKGRWAREKVYQSAFSKECERCGGSAIALHHIDYDNSNENISNLMSVCKSCHYYLHSHEGRGRWARAYSACILCKTTEKPHVGNGFCYPCALLINRIENHPNYAWSKKYPLCQACGSVERAYHGRGLCYQCWNRLPKSVEYRKKRLSKVKDGTWVRH